jgi:hypothetical protein
MPDSSRVRYARLVHISKWLGVGLCVGIGLGACGDDGETGTYTAGSGIGGSDGLGVGESCTSTASCRPGLSCETDGVGKTCQPAGTLTEGEDCILSAECGAGLYCAEGVCAPAGSGGEGAPCQTLADCQKEFTCDVMTSMCTGIGDETGKGDLGDDCSVSSDCYSPLVCNEEGNCAIAGGGTGSGGSGSGGSGVGGSTGPGGGSSEICMTDGNCSPVDDDCVCPDCDMDPFCSDPSHCINDSQCKTFEEGCICADCMSHPECLDN